MRRKVLLYLFILFSLNDLYSQNISFTREIRGTITDNVLQKPIQGASVTLQSAGKSVLTDANGNFKFTNVEVGSQHLHITHIEYKEIFLDNIIVSTGKETVLTISLETNVHSEKEVTVKANSKKNKPLNDMSVVSARAFTVEETQKYAAAVNDPLRMATGFPGVMTPDDGNNEIVIRGNSPMGLLWRMEGIDIPNPNHFGNTGSSGGGISILSSQLLSNSDFITGAFASEYGNALSGVFDLKLRKGNNTRREYTLQAGLLGLNAAAEGPFKAGYKGSYLINYRYSTLELLNKLGLSLGEGSTNFQDLAYNIYLPAGKAGTFTLFGFGGLSSQNEKMLKDSAQWKSKDDRYIEQFVSNTFMNGITHSVLLGERTSLRSAVGLSSNKISDDTKYIEDDYSASEQYKDSYKTKKLTASTLLNHRVNTKNSFRAGAIVNFIHINYYQLSKDNPDVPLEEKINDAGNLQTVQAFGQWQYKASNNLTFNGGLHYLQLVYNHSSSIEPRVSVKWDMNRKNSFAVGYGLHSQLQPLGVYFVQTQDSNGDLVQLNKDLELTKSHHFVLSHNYRLGKNLRLKTELYYQHLFNVPVSVYDTSSFSMLNVASDYVTEPLINKGKGKNYGIEVSLEKYLADNFYYTLSNSFYQSKYTASDGKERNTRFNGNYIISLLAGKDFVSTDKLRTFSVNIKAIYAGGYRTTPIDVQASQENGYTVFKQQDAYSLQNPAYFRTDLRISKTWNRRHLTSTLSLDIQNVTNRQNIYNQWFDADNGTIVKSYQVGIIPILNYKVEF